MKKMLLALALGAFLSTGAVAQTVVPVEGLFVTIPAGSGGTPGPAGPPGSDGKSAYQVWLDNGNTGDVNAYLLSLKGAKGDTGNTGATGQQGAQGPQGIQGIQGPPGSGGGGGSGLPIVTDETTFNSLVSAAISGCKVLSISGESKFNMATARTFTLPDCGHDPVGLIANGATINCTVNNGADCLTFVTNGTRNRSFLLEKLHVFGGAYVGLNSANCIKIKALKNADIYKFTLRDIWVDYCGQHGVVIEGAVFEGSIWNLQAENNNLSGLYMAHDTVGGGNQGIVSNIFVWGANVSRNKRYGIEAGNAATSFELYAPSMVENGMGGTLFPWGVRSINGGNCENSGTYCHDIGSSGTILYKTMLGTGMELSTNCSSTGHGGSTIAQYLVRAPASQNSKLYYNEAGNTVTRYAGSCAVGTRAP